MTKDRKEPTLSGLAPPRDEPAASAPTGQPAAAASRQRPRPTPVSARQSGSSPLVPAVLVLALLGLGLAGFTGWQWQQASQQIAAADDRIHELEQRLTLTDDEASQSVTTLQASLKEARESLELAHSEIRKLWDTRNVNRQGITDNEQGLAALDKKVSSAASAAAAASKQASALETRVQSLTSDMALQKETLTLASDQLESQQQKIRELVDQSRRLDSKLSQLQTDLARRVKTNEDAIKAIDASRVSVNRDILELKRRLGADSLP